MSKSTELIRAAQRFEQHMNALPADERKRFLVRALLYANRKDRICKEDIEKMTDGDCA